MTSGSGRLVTIKRSHAGVRRNSAPRNDASSFRPPEVASSRASMSTATTPALDAVAAGFTGSARFFSGLGVADFYKSSHILSYTKKALENIREPLEKVAGIERLSKHLDSVKVRFE